MQRPNLDLDDPAFVAWKRKRDNARLLAEMLAGDDEPPERSTTRSTTRLALDAYRPFLLAAGAVLVLLVLLALMGG